MTVSNLVVFGSVNVKYSFSSISNNANNVERQVQSKPLEKPVVANVSCLKSEGSKNENSNNFSSSSKPSDYHQVYNKSFNNKDTNNKNHGWHK